MDPLAARIQELCLLRGNFTLRSGRIATEYFDKYRFEAEPEVLAEVSRRMVPLIPPGTQVLAGLEMGGIPIATMLSHLAGLPAAFVRKTAKAYGTARLCEGADVSGKHVLIVEDVITSGGADSTGGARPPRTWRAN
jgi:orotate phosphoribosyltransferase